MTPSALHPVRLSLVALALAAAGCGTPGTEPGPALGPAGDVVRGADDPMPGDLFPFVAAVSRFVLVSGETRTVRVEPVPGTDAAAVVRIEGAATTTRIDVARREGSVVFSAGPDSNAELIRVGAVPGTTWQSGETAVEFTGWERIVVPAGTYDAARVTTKAGPETLRVIQTWWFAPGTGIVRLRSDRGGIFTDEMSRAGSE